MSEILHEIDVFCSLATGEPGLARDWASGRLALFAPPALEWFPEEPMTADVVLAAKPEGLIRTIIRTLRDAEPVSEELASAMTAIGAYGAMPRDTEELVTALREARTKAGAAAGLWLALACSLAGDVEPTDIEAAAKADILEKSWVLPTLLVKLAEQSEAVDIQHLAHEMLPRMLTEHQLLPAMLETLGTPASGAFHTPIENLEQAIAVGAVWAGARPRELDLGQGGQRNRTRNAVHQLLENETGPAANWVRALYCEHDAVKLGFGPVIVASWLQHYSPGNPVFDVLRCSAGTTGHALSRARNLINETNQQDVLNGLERPHPVEASILALDLRSQTVDPILHGLLGRISQPGESQLRAEVPAIVAFAPHGGEIARLLEHENTVDLGLRLAEWSPTIPVLAALLGLPTPDRPQRVNRFARALAGMGDSAALSRLSGLTISDQRTAVWCQNLCYALLGKSS
jgi:hypothetical protein